MDAKARALEVPCPFCGADIGQSCVENGEPYPPHRGRVMLVQRIDDAPSQRDEILREQIEIAAERARKMAASDLTRRMFDDFRRPDVVPETSVPAAKPKAVAHQDQTVRFIVQTTYSQQRELGDDDQTARARVNERLLAIGGEVPTEDEMNAAAARYDAREGK